MRVAVVLLLVFSAGFFDGLPAVIAASAAFGWLVRDLEQKIRVLLVDHPYPRRKKR